MNTNNVYSGPDSLKKYFDPDFQPPLPLVELPAHLNPFYQDGVRIYAKMMTMLPANNVKAIPAMNLLEGSIAPGRTTRILEYSSGSTVISMSMVARALHGVDDTRAYLSNKTTDAKLRLMQFFGLRLRLFGGPSQPEPTDPRGGIQAAKREAGEEGGTVNPNQYENDANWKAHYRWTGPQLLRQLPSIDVICSGMGTSGTMTGIGTFFADHKPSVRRVGVCTAAGDRVPGPRSLALMSPVEFPWRAAVDAVEEVSSEPSYALSLRLSREGLVCGPSSGFNLQGLLQFLAGHEERGTLDSLRSSSSSPDDAAADTTTTTTDNIHCVFLCCDLPYQYVDEYFDKLDVATHFHPIENHDLVAVDRYRYDESWELGARDAVARFGTAMPTLDGRFWKPLPDVVVVDLRQPADFQHNHLPDAVNRPLHSLPAGRTRPNPFRDAGVLAEQWTELDGWVREGEIFGVAYGADELRNISVLVVCYDGDTARVATSVLRAKKVNAFSVRGGMDALARFSIQSMPELIIPEVAVAADPIASAARDLRAKVLADVEVRDVGLGVEG